MSSVLYFLIGIGVGFFVYNHARKDGYKYPEIACVVCILLWPSVTAIILLDAITDIVDYINGKDAQ